MHDAHLHLADPVFQKSQAEILDQLRSSGWSALVVNGTSESDWPRVASLAQVAPDLVRPSYGLHPWYVKARSANWFETIETRLSNDPRACVGECGLDRWIKNHDIEDQLLVLEPQIELATRLNRPLTLHCLKAWGPLVEILSRVNLPARGFLVHACSASEEVMTELLKLGARFSYSTYFSHPRKQAIRDVYAKLPLDRLLIETDAPAMAPPAELSRSPFADPKVNHPANLAVALDSLQEIRDESADMITAQLEKNFHTFFGA